MNDSTPKSWWKRLSGGLKRTSSSLGGAIADLISKRKLDAGAIEDLEHELIRADLGPEFAARMAAALAGGRFDKAIAPDDVKAVLAGEIENVLAPVAKPLEVTARPFIILVAGVNGSGKTTAPARASWRASRAPTPRGWRSTRSPPPRRMASISCWSIQPAACRTAPSS
jgi:fused signal recognition particle receptor